MGTCLLIAEKPSAARKFAAALGGMQGSFDGQPYRIVALRGHLMELARPEEQVAPEHAGRMASWDPAAMPWDRSLIAWRRVPREGAADALQEAERALSALGPGDEAVIATDSDPSGEGELLAWEVLEEAGYAGAVSRMRFADEEPATVRAALAARTPIPSPSADGELAKAAARDKWDYLSMQITRLATAAARSKGHDALVRAGRLKSVMVSEVGRQLAAHATYERVPYYEVRYRDELGNAFARADAEEAGLRAPSPDEAGLGAHVPCKVVVDGTRQTRKAPPALPDLGRLASKLAKEGHEPAEVMATYQALYEDGIVSYPRTEDKTVTQAQFEELLPLTEAIAAAVGVDPSLLTHRAPRKSHVGEGGAHGANRPGPNVPGDLRSLARYGSSAEAIYALVARSWLATLAPDATWSRTDAHLEGAQGYVARATVPADPGWRAVLGGEGDEGDGEGAEARFGELAEPYVHEGAPERPKAPTMEWLERRLERYEVGTGATRASTLAEAADGSKRALMAQDKGRLTLTEAGSLSLLLLDGCMIADPAATERLASDMAAVGRFEIGEEDLLRGFDELLAHDMGRIEANARKLPEARGAGACPRCGAPVRRRGRAWSCATNRHRQGEDGTWELVEGCGFRLSPFAGRELSEEQASRLLSGQRVALKGLKARSGKRYDCELELDAGSEHGCRPVFDGRGSRKRGTGRR